MKVILMCAGKGERLGELTRDTPKCLLSIGGRTMLEWWLDKFCAWRFTPVLINTNHGDKIRNYLGHYYWGVDIEIVNEETSLGTAKTLYKNQWFFTGDKSFLVIYSDVWTTFDLRKLVDYHKETNADITLGIHETNKISSKSLVTVDDNNSVIGFVEKPLFIEEGFSWSGLAVMGPYIWNCMKEDMVDIGSDFLSEVFKWCNVKALEIKDPVYDIGGSVEQYNMINEEVLKIVPFH